MASPLAVIGANHQYTLSLQPLGGATGVITIDRDASTVRRHEDRVADRRRFDDITIDLRELVAWRV
jgi:hypothetical protein